MGIKWSDNTAFAVKARADIDPATWQIPGITAVPGNFKTTVQNLVDSASPFALRQSSALSASLKAVTDNAATPNESQLYLATNKTSVLGALTVGFVGFPDAQIHNLGQGSTNATVNFLAENFTGAELIKVFDGLKITFLNALVTIDQAGAFKFDMDGSSARFGAIFSNAYSAASAAQGYLAFKDYNTGEDVSRLYDGSARKLLVSDGNTFTGMNSCIIGADSTTKGIGLPVMTTTQKNNIASPRLGLKVFDSTLDKECVFTASTGWQTVTSV